MDRTAPTGSSRVACGSRESGTTCIAPTKAATSSGTLIQNTDDHEKLRMSAPPTIGPSAMPAPLAAVHAAIALARSRGSPNTLTRIDSVVGMISAPPTPITPRAAISVVVDVAEAAAIEPARNVARPARSACRRPNRSPRLPAVSKQTSEDDGVAGDDPLQLGGARAQIADESGQGDVDDGVVDRGDQQREHEHAEDAPPLGWLAWVSPRDWVIGRPCMMTPWVWWCALVGRVGSWGYGSRWVISSMTTPGWSISMWWPVSSTDTRWRRSTAPSSPAGPGSTPR